MRKKNTPLWCSNGFDDGTHILIKNYGKRFLKKVPLLDSMSDFVAWIEHSENPGRAQLYFPGFSLRSIQATGTLLNSGYISSYVTQLNSKNIETTACIP